MSSNKAMMVNWNDAGELREYVTELMVELMSNPVGLILDTLYPEVMIGKAQYRRVNAGITRLADLTGMQWDDVQAELHAEAIQVATD